jgi:predicted PurR-regulated permease PerM
MEWRVSNQAILKILGAVVVCAILVRLAPLLIILSFALLLACALQPALERLERRLPHWAAALTVTIAVILLLAGVIFGVMPALVDQSATIARRLPDAQAALLKNVPGGLGQQFVRRLLQNPEVISGYLLSAGQAILGTAGQLALIVALALYLAADGKRTYAWLRAYFSPAHRKKIDLTARESAEIIVAYVVGQFITSALCGIFVFVVLHALRVPGALVLAVVAAVFDVLPMVGFFLFTIPAMLFALAVSLNAALSVLGLYLGYHLVENYIIVPRVYGSRLRLSDLVVLTSVLAGACLAGIPGAILILPLVAVYPAVERIWLEDYIGRDVVEKHDAVEHSPSK